MPVRVQHVAGKLPMGDNPLEAVYSFVERAYMRLQAGDILIRCLEEGNASPMHQMVEALVLAGPQSLNSLQEILSEVGRRKSQVLDDLHQVFNDLQNNLKKHGVRLTGINNALLVTRLSYLNFLAMLREQGITENQAQIDCMQLLKDSKELIINLAAHLNLLDEIENYLQDWVWGLAYQSAHQDFNNPGVKPSDINRQH